MDAKVGCAMDAENCLLLCLGLLNRVTRHYIYTMGNHKNLYLSIDPETSQKRNCLRCEKLFLSEHIGNRLCPKCEKRS